MANTSACLTVSMPRSASRSRSSSSISAGARRRADRRLGGARGREVRAHLADELDHVAERRVVAQLEVVLARDAVFLPHAREDLRLLDGVDAEVGLEVEV